MFETQSINDAFKLPIEYNKNKNKISESIQEDLELKDKENTVSLYNYVYEPKRCQPVDARPKRQRAVATFVFKRCV